MKPIDKLREHIESDGIKLTCHNGTLVWGSITIGDLRSLVAEHDRLTAELAQAKLIGAAEECDRLAGVCYTNEQDAMAWELEARATELRERAARDTAESCTTPLTTPPASDTLAGT